MKLPQLEPNGSEILSKDDYAELLYHQIAYKIYNLKDMPEKIERIGMFNLKDVRGTFTSESYSDDVILQALIKCARGGWLDMYYSVECPSCATINNVLEPSVGSSTTLVDLREGVIKCQFCDDSVSSRDSIRDLKSVELIFCISDEFQTESYKSSLTSDTSDKLVDNEPYLHRIARWLKLKS